MSKKTKAVNAYVKLLGKASWMVESEEDAINLVNNVCEGEFNAKTDWDNALQYFKDYFPGYSRFMDEQNEY